LSVVDGHLVGALAYRFEIGREAKLGPQADTCLGDHLALGAGMTATGIGPQAGTVVFHAGAALQENLPLRVKDENRERPVQASAGRVRAEFFLGAKRVIVLIDQHYVIEVTGFVGVSH
jgi:hypothetical protein